MTQIHKIIGYKGQYFSKEYETIKHHKNKIRYLREETVAKQFKKGDVEIIVHFEDKSETITIDEFSNESIIMKYLGKKFIKR